MSLRRLQTIVECCERGAPVPPDEAAWLVDAYRRAVVDRVALDKAMGLGSGWWRRVALDTHRAAIRKLRERFFGDLGVTAAADEMSKLGRRYQATAWRHDQSKAGGQLLRDPKRDLVAEALATGINWPGERQMLNILNETR